MNFFLIVVACIGLEVEAANECYAQVAPVWFDSQEKCEEFLKDVPPDGDVLNSLCVPVELPINPIQGEKL